ncbi:MAG: VCBS domain-containing protein, partial [Planctomycetota bacterium]
GIATIGGACDFALVRYNQDGSLDTSFGTGGKVTTPVGTSNDWGYSGGYSVTIQPDGKIVVAGRAYNGSNTDFALVRYNADGSLDARFDLASTLGGSVSYTENGSPVVLDSNVQIFDAELSGSNFSGATLTLVRNGGASAQDLFSSTGTLGTLTQGGNLTVGGTTIGTVTTNSSGTLVLTFNSSATNALVNSAMQQIAYANSSDGPPASVQIEWTFSDGNTGAQGTGGALTATGSVTVNITGANDAPTAVADSDTAVEAGGISNANAGTNPSGNVLTNDTDPDSGDSLSVIGVAAGTVPSAAGNVGIHVAGNYGQIHISTNGDYVYLVDNSDPAVQALRSSAQTLADTFTYTMRDAAGLTSTTQITITIQGVNDAPHDITGTLTVSESATNGDSVGTVTGEDADSGETFTYQLLDSAGGRFAINSSTGEVTVANSSLLDYETDSTHQVTIRVTDLAGATYETTLTVNILPANDAPTLNSAASPTMGTVLEGATNPSGVTVADLVVDSSITDQD